MSNLRGAPQLALWLRARYHEHYYADNGTDDSETVRQSLQDAAAILELASPTLRGAPTPAMIAAALEYYDGNIGVSPADRRVAATWMGELLRAALTAQDLPTEQQPAREAQPKPD